MSRHFQALARIGLAVVGTLAVPSIASAQYNRVPDPNATRVLVAVFKAGEKGLGVQAADAVRSRMNAPFFLPDVALDTDFLQGAQARGLMQLKGHKSVGGMRASIYNAMPLEGVLTLIDYLKDFEKAHG